LAQAVTCIEPGLISVNGNSSFREVNAELGQFCLSVEPLSEKISISRFIKEGGVGYNSLQEGTLGSKIFQISSSFDEIKFTYGSKYKTLYNAGYSLHRIMEGPLFSKNVAKRFGQVEKIILPVKKKKNVEVSFHNIQLDQLHIPDHASNVFFINNFCAEIMGLEGEGIVTVHRNETNVKRKIEKKAWQNRFLEDRIPAGHNTMKFLIMKSRLDEIYKIFNENVEGLFFALYVHNGILVLISGKRGQLDKVGGKIKKTPLSFELMG